MVQLGTNLLGLRWLFLLWPDLGSRELVSRGIFPDLFRPPQLPDPPWRLIFRLHPLETKGLVVALGL